MSKMDDMRAMREANFAATPPPTARATRPTDEADDVPVAPARTAAPAKKAPAKKAPAPAGAPTGTAVTAGDDTRRCGHRAISGRSCTREHGHEEKSHRYG